MAVARRLVTRRPAETLRRNDDPVNSHVAVEEWYPTGQTCLERCLDLLLHRAGEWVDATEFVAPDIGGLNATRRLRELRESDPSVETRLKPGSATIWQWRYRSPRAVLQPVAPAPDSAALKRHEPKRRGRGAQSKPAATPATHRPDPTAGMTEDEKDAYLRKKSGL